MQLSSTDLQHFKSAIAAAKASNMTSVILHAGLIRGISEPKTSAILSKTNFSEELAAISIGIGNIDDLSKKMSIYGDDFSMAIDVTDAQKARKFLFKAGRFKGEYRCTDEKIIRAPKSNNDVPFGVFTLKRSDIVTFVKAVKTPGAEFFTLQTKRDQTVRAECTDSTGNKFEIDFESTIEYFTDMESSVTVFDSTSANGIVLSLLEQAARDNEDVDIAMAESGNLTIVVKQHTIIALPRADLGD